MAHDRWSGTPNKVTTARSNTITIAHWSVKCTDNLVDECTVYWNVGPPTSVCHLVVSTNVNSPIEDDIIDPPPPKASYYVSDVAPKNNDPVTYNTAYIANTGNVAVDVDNGVDPSVVAHVSSKTVNTSPKNSDN